MLAFSDIDKQFDLYVSNMAQFAREEGIEKGREEGIEIGEIKGFYNALVGLVKDKILTVSQAAQRANMSVEEFKKKTGLKDE
ncbi:MAG: hypothetical protein IJS61_11165 [Firmicutes bacterium]|nr:hypothetical protein [Bacillota bacterium]